MANVHVVPQGDAWACEVDGKRRSEHTTKAEAIKRGGELAAQEQGELVIHRAEEKTGDQHPHGSDPDELSA